MYVICMDKNSQKMFGHIRKNMVETWKTIFSIKLRYRQQARLLPQAKRDDDNNCKAKSFYVGTLRYVTCGSLLHTCNQGVHLAFSVALHDSIELINRCTSSFGASNTIVNCPPPQ